MNDDDDDGGLVLKSPPPITSLDQIQPPAGMSTSCAIMVCAEEQIRDASVMLERLTINQQGLFSTATSTVLVIIRCLTVKPIIDDMGRSLSNTLLLGTIFSTMRRYLLLGAL